MENKSEYGISKSLICIVLILELFSSLERQVFDFLGYMWLPILANFINIILVILGIFGVFEKRTAYLVSYLVWTFFWISWNIFLICFYKNIGYLNNETQDLLSLGTGSFSWWFVNGVGCEAEYHFNTEDIINAKPTPYRPSNVKGCKMNYEDIEVCHAGIQIILGLLGMILGIIISIQTNKVTCHSSKSMYSIKYSPKIESNRRNQSSDSTTLQMTIRRMKRRHHTRNSRQLESQVRFNQPNQRNLKNIRNPRFISSPRHNYVVNPINRLIKEVGQKSNENKNTNSSNNQELNNSLFEYSRPNSLYGTMIVNEKEKVDRSPSRLTSYSNFHQQRKVLTENNNVPNVFTQDLLSPEEDLPLPPPPITQHFQQVPKPAQQCNNKNYYENVTGNKPTLTSNFQQSPSETYWDSKNLYAEFDKKNNAFLRKENGSIKVTDHEISGAIPKKSIQFNSLIDGEVCLQVPIDKKEHRNGCQCYICQHNLTAI
ncbi:uncharacterized protein NKAIN [Lepeophtheirus salmonis]|uniref:Sodium/potassium-transporting ATPase subunit beta-1-interacting protein n=1 Tax=Lepeophtheirus salmonis TaxID=72036 RepID=A0A0K2T2N1_LEPSM|nr:sodium/potassium-transporting ATPase subunit beta-1-interacting protein-like [Lepeophtheirus salmonis]XP_040578108.1 sodium/potassium-transporting ATPase subunit beta-1-interacting protein-like [Lepeophtheirus salmonis]XP_040578109.1 sodium/potassium-transporting ATPase subunit beta-1-interacting protein-like [Lepeophtheirus salmonis]